MARRRSRNAVLLLACAALAPLLLGGGVTAWLAILGNTDAAKGVASAAILLGLILFVALWRHQGRDSTREALRGALEAKVVRGQHIAGAGTSAPLWLLQNSSKWGNETFALLDEYLGPVVAQGFVQTGTHEAGALLPAARIQREVSDRVEYLQKILKGLGKAELMGDSGGDLGAAGA